MDARVPGGTDTQPFSLATSRMYSFDVAQVMNVRAASPCFDVAGIARFQLQSQVGAPLKLPVGISAKPTLSATVDCFLSYSSPPATVASIHMPQWPLANSARFSLKPFEVAPSGPSAFRMSA